jgi:hypothetical protein
VRVGQRQKREDAFIVENLPRDSLMRLIGTDGRHQRMMVVVPEGQRDIGFVA